MDYSQKSLTKDGLLMLSESDADGTSLVIDKMIVSQQIIDSTIDLKYLTLADFTSPIEFDVNSIQKNDDSFQVKAAVTNNLSGNVLNSDYKIGLIGVVAHTSTDTTDKLLGVVVGTDPFILPAYNNVPVSYIVGITFGYSNVSNITIQIKNDIYALSVDVQALDKATVKDNHNGAITVNGVTFTPADDKQVVHDNHDGSIKVNGKSITPTTADDVIELNNGGGRNYALNTAEAVIVQGNGGAWQNIKRPMLSKNLAGQELTWSYDVTIDKADTGEIYLQFGTNFTPAWGVPITAKLKELTPGITRHYEITSVFPTFDESKGDFNNFMLIGVTGSNAKVTFEHLMVETGKVAHDYVPAPEDKADKADVTQALNQANTYADLNFGDATQEFWNNFRQRLTWGITAKCPVGTDFDVFLKSDSVQTGMSIVRENNTSTNWFIIKESDQWVYGFCIGINQSIKTLVIYNGVYSKQDPGLSIQDIKDALDTKATLQSDGSIKNYPDMWHGYMSGTPDFNNYTENGYYGFSGLHFYNAPTSLSAGTWYGYLKIINSGGAVFQELDVLVETHISTYKRVWGGLPATWGAWQQLTQANV